MKYQQPLGDVNPNAGYIDGNETTGQEGSPVPAKAIEHVMREIINVITSAGLIPSEADLTQLAQAITLLAPTIVAASTTVQGKVELTTGTEALGGTDTSRAVTSSALASSKNLAINGFYQLPGNFILQWGTGIVPVGATTITLPTAFTTEIYAVFASGANNNNVSANAYKNGANLNNILVQPNTGSGGPYAMHWFALGK